MSDDEQAAELDSPVYTTSLSSFAFAVDGDEWTAAHEDADAALRQLRDALERMESLSIHLDTSDETLTLIFEGEGPIADSDTTSRSVRDGLRKALRSYGIPD